MKKRILSLALLVCLILPFGIMLSGCDTKEDASSTQIEQIQTTKTLNANDAYNLYNLALIQYEMGYKDTRTNLKITSNTHNDVYKFYTTTDGIQVVVDQNFLYWQEKNGSAYTYNISTNKKSNCGYSHFKELHSSYSLNIHNHLKENLKSYDIDDNGNYVFIFASKNEDNTTMDYQIFEYVVSPDFKFISTDYAHVNYAKDGSHSPINFVNSRHFEYNAITEEEILPVLTTARQASVE